MRCLAEEMLKHNVRPEFKIFGIGQIDEVQTLAFDFIPVSMLFQKSHCIRVETTSTSPEELTQWTIRF
jgi:hypothetical protein